MLYNHEASYETNIAKRIEKQTNTHTKYRESERERERAKDKSFTALNILIHLLGIK